jgi:hypothetical protein
MVAGSTNGGRTGIVDEGVGVGVAELVGDGEVVADGVDVAEGDGDGVSAAKSGEGGPSIPSGRLNISPVRINFRRSTGHCCIIKASTAR